MEYREYCEGNPETRVVADSEQSQLLEIYKLHAELADRVSQRREGANRLYVSLLVGLVIFLAALLRFGIGDAPVKLVLCTVSFFGVLLSASWFVVIKSYQQLNREKFRVLHDLETRLVYQFFTLEWDPKVEGKKSSRYWRLTHVEQALPFIFLALFAGLTTYALYQ